MAPAGALQSKELETKIRNLTWHNDELRKQIFEAAQRGHRLANSMGFDNLDDAEAAVAAHPEVFNREFLKDVVTRVESLQNELDKSAEQDKSVQEMLKKAYDVTEDARKENADLLRQITRIEDENKVLKSRLEAHDCKSRRTLTGLQTPTTASKGSKARKDATPPHAEDAPSSETVVHPDGTPSQLKLDIPAPVNLELQELQRKYDALRSAKARSEAKYNKDYTKWREFKQWMCDLEKESPGNLTGDKQKDQWRRILRIRHEFKKMGPRVSADPDTLDEHLNEDHLMPPVEQPDDVLSLHVDSVQVEAKSCDDTAAQAVQAMPPPPATPPHKRTFDDTLSTDSETEDDSQAPAPVDHTQPGLRLLTSSSPLRMARVPYQPPPRRRRAAPAVEADPATSPKDAPSCQRPSEASDSKPSSSKAFGSGLAMISPSATPTPQASRGQDKKTKTKTSIGKNYPTDYSAFKGRGRYARNVYGDTTTINATYKIDTQKNDGRDFQYHEVVRNKQQRKCKLHGKDCLECQEYYESIGPMPPRMQPPLWRSPQSTPSKLGPSTSRKHEKSRDFDDISDVIEDFDDGMDEAARQRQRDIEKHRNEISRHREKWDAPLTPPKYWSIGMPDTQEVANINALAKVMEEQKRRRIEMEVKKDGKYKRR